MALGDAMFDRLMRRQDRLESISSILPSAFTGAENATNVMSTAAEAMTLDAYEQAIEEFKSRTFIRELGAYFKANPIIGTPGDYLMRWSPKRNGQPKRSARGRRDEACSSQSRNRGAATETAKHTVVSDAKVLEIYNQAMSESYDVLPTGPIDAYKTVAAYIFSVPYESVTKEQRRTAKFRVLSLLYVPLVHDR